MTSEAIVRVELTVEPKWLAMFGVLLSQGFIVGVETGVSLRAVLCEQLGIADDYLENRIKTIFLNGQAVDDVDQAVVKNGAVVAISAAMPGLVGAIMRRGGLYAGFRNSISYRDDGQRTAVRSGVVHLKLFNLVARELGPHFLAQGIQIDSRQWQAFLSGKPEDFKQGLVAACIDGKPVATAELFAMSLPPGDIQLTVTVP